MKDDSKSTVEKQRKANGGADKLINFRPVLFCALFLGFGMACCYFIKSDGAYLLWCALPILLLIALLFFRTKLALYRVLTLVAVFAVGMGAFVLQTASFTKGTAYDNECVFKGKVVDRTETADLFSITLDGVNIDGKQEKGRLVAYLPASFAETVSLSDEVLLRGKVRSDYRLFSDGKFRSYAIENNIRFYAYADDCAVTGRVFDPFLSVRSRMETVIRAGMDETPASVTLAVLTGNTDLMDNELLDNVRRGGIAHIFAVSGLHVGALFGFFLWLVKKTKLQKLPKIARFGLLATAILFYGGGCGFSASVVRAIATCLALYASNLIGIGKDGIESVSLAAIIVLLLSPVSLFAVGFQLSFAACYGIAFLSLPIRKTCYAVGRKFISEEKRKEAENHPPSVSARIMRKCVSYFSVTLSAQLATAPLLLYAFGYLSVWSLLLNGIAVPLISAFFSLLLALVLLACVLPIGACFAVLYLPNMLWSAFLLLFQLADFSAFTPAGFCLQPLSFAPYFLALTFLSDKWNLPKWVRFTVCGALLLTFWVMGIIPARQ